MKASSILIVLVISTILNTTPTKAQETPTPAPTKTETAQETYSATENTGELTLTQNDLQVITGNVQRPNGAVWFNDMIYIICSGDWTIYELEDPSGSTRTYIYGIRNGHSLHAETDENNELTLWVPDFATNQLMLVNPVRAPQPIAENLNAPWGITPHGEDHFLVTSFNGNSIYQISRSGEASIILEELRSPTGIAADDDFVYVANSGSARRAIEWFEKPDTESIGTITAQPLVSGLQNTTGIALGSDGNLYFAHSLGTRGVVGRIDPQECRDNGGCSNDEVEIVVYTELAAPLAGLTLSPDMRLFIHTMFRPEVYWVQIAS